MSGHRIRPHSDGANLEPLIINRDPCIINRSPERPPVPRAASETRKAKSVKVFNLFNPFSGSRRNTLLVTERKVRHTRGDSDTEPSSPATSSTRGRPSTRPSPPVIVQRTTQSNPPAPRVFDMPQGQREYVPLPPVLPKEVKWEEQNDSGRESRQSRQSQTTEEIVRVIEEPKISRHSSRRHRRYHSTASNPLADQEQVIPTSPRPRPMSGNYQVITPNEPVRSRPTDDDVRSSKEYVRMKEAAEQNYKAAEEYARRYSTAEVRLQNLQKQLAESTSREGELRHELEKTLAKLDACRCGSRANSREKELKAQIAQDQLDNERQRRQELERERERERAKERRDDVTHDSSGGGGRRHRIRVHKVHQTDESRKDAQPRTPDPRATAAAATPAANAGTIAMEQARADAAAKLRR